MSPQNSRQIKIMIIEDEEDNLILYKDYLTSRGHDVYSYLTTDNVMTDFDKFVPDISLIDHRLVGSMDGLGAAIKILTKHPSSRVLFITGYEPLYREIFNDPFFKDKKISVLMKPVLLEKIESTILRLVN
jgi:DNA-binding NtrC family response regulator